MSSESLGQTEEDCSGEQADMLVWFNEQALFKRIAKRLDKEYNLLLDPESIEDVITVYREEILLGDKE